MKTLKSELRNFKLHFSIIIIPRVEMTWLLLGPISNNMQYDTLHMQSACDSCKKKMSAPIGM